MTNNKKAHATLHSGLDLSVWKKASYDFRVHLCLVNMSGKGLPERVAAALSSAAAVVASARSRLANCLSGAAGTFHLTVPQKEVPQEETALQTLTPVPGPQAASI